MIVVGDRVAYAQWRWNDLREGTVRAIWPCGNTGFEDCCTVYSVRDDAVYMFTYVHSIGGVLLPRIDWHADEYVEVTQHLYERTNDGYEMVYGEADKQLYARRGRCEY